MTGQTKLPKKLETQSTILKKNDPDFLRYLHPAEKRFSVRRPVSGGRGVDSRAKTLAGKPPVAPRAAAGTRDGRTHTGGTPVPQAGPGTARLTEDWRASAGVAGCGVMGDSGRMAGDARQCGRSDGPPPEGAGDVRAGRRGVGLFDAARWYDLGIDWTARLGREVPVLGEELGPPGGRGLLDAACGTGRHLVAMVEAGYRVTGLDASAAMLAETRLLMAEHGVDWPLIEATFEEAGAAAGPFDGVYCLGNSLAAAGSGEAVERSVAALGSVLAAGGRLFVQVLNFAKLREEEPAVRGPRVRREGGVEYVSTRVFSFCGDAVEITNVTLWNDGGWRQFAGKGRLHAVSQAELSRCCAAAGLTIDATYGSYKREAFDPATSNDLIVVATKGGSRPRSAARVG